MQHLRITVELLLKVQTLKFQPRATKPSLDVCVLGLWIFKVMQGILAFSRVNNHSILIKEFDSTTGTNYTMPNNCIM